MNNSYAAPPTAARAVVCKAEHIDQRPDPPPLPGPHVARLREATAQRHRRVEQRVDVRASFASRAAYRRLLERLLGFHEPVSHRFRQIESVAPGLLPGPPRVKRLEADIWHLSGDPTAAPRCQTVPEASDPATALGLLYVVEGSALGGEILARLAAKRLGLSQAAGASFFAGDPVDGAQRWSGVLATIELTGAAGELRAVISGACQAFDCLDAWLAGLHFGGSVST